MTHIKTYTKQDGTVVREHDTTQVKAWWAKHPILSRLVPKAVTSAPAKPAKFPGAIIHPNLNEKNKPVVIHEPHKETAPATWTDPKAIATFLPGGVAPESLNGVPMTPWTDAPKSESDWEEVEGQDFNLDEPEFDPAKEPAAGVVIEEDDGRVWVIHPTNQFGGYKATFPKGHQEEFIGLQASAIKEAYEESGLKVEITGFLMDVERTTTTCRYYTARRVGGTPRAAGWESQAISLVPRANLYEVLNRNVDHPLAEALGAGPAPAYPEWAASHPKGPKSGAGNQPGLFDHF